MTAAAVTTIERKPKADPKRSVTKVKLTTERIESGDGFNYNKIRATYFCFRISTGCVVPFMALYMQHKGLSPSQIGSLQAIRPIVTLLCGPLWGSLSDRPGWKKSVLLLLYISSVAFRLCLSFVGSNVLGFAIALCSSSMFYSAVPSILDSIVVSSMPEHERTNFGRVRLWGELGNGVSSSIMMTVINSESYGFESLFIVHAITSAFGFMCLLSFVPEGSPIQRVQEENKNKAIEQNTSVKWKDGFRLIISDIQILGLFSLVILMGYTLGFVENFCYMNMRQIYERNGQPIGKDMTICRMCVTIGGIISWFFAGSWGKRFGTEIVMFASVCCLPFCLFLYGGVTSELNNWTKAGFFLAESIRSGVYASLWSTATVRLNKLSPLNMKSTMQSLMESTYRGFGHTSGAFFGGILCKKYGDMSEAFIVAGKGLLSFLIAAGTMFYTLPQKELA